MSSDAVMFEIETLYGIEKTADERIEACANVFTSVFTNLVNGQHDVVDRYMRDIDLERIVPSIMFSFLSATLSYSRSFPDALKERPRFFQRVEERLTQLGRTSEQVAWLLHGLQ